MSKRAEEEAWDAYPYVRGAKGVVCEQSRPIFIRGYERAEKDLALTWEDIAKIDAIISDVNNEFAVDYSKEISRQKFYEEVLKRFNEQKNKK